MPTPISVQDITSVPYQAPIEVPLTGQDYYWDIVTQQNSSARASLSNCSASRDGSYGTNGLTNQDQVWLPDPTDAYPNGNTRISVSSYSSLSHALGTPSDETSEVPTADGVPTATGRAVLGDRNINISTPPAQPGLPTVTDFSR